MKLNYVLSPWVVSILINSFLCLQEHRICHGILSSKVSTRKINARLCILRFTLFTQAMALCAVVNVIVLNETWRMSLLTSLRSRLLRLLVNINLTFSFILTEFSANLIRSDSSMGSHHQVSDVFFWVLKKCLSGKCLLFLLLALWPEQLLVLFFFLQLHFSVRVLFSPTRVFKC